MSFKLRKSKLRYIRPGDNGWMLDDGIVKSPRAGFEISNRCPENYREIIQECIGYGWFKPVATMTEREILFVGLSKDL